jgi:hypothetical protein
VLIDNPEASQTAELKRQLASAQQRSKELNDSQIALLARIAELQGALEAKAGAETAHFTAFEQLREQLAAVTAGQEEAERAHQSQVQAAEAARGEAEARLAEERAQGEALRLDLEREREKGLAARELLRRSEGLQFQVKRLQEALQEERRGRGKDDGSSGSGNSADQVHQARPLPADGPAAATTASVQQLQMDVARKDAQLEAAAMEARRLKQELEGLRRELAPGDAGAHAAQGEARPASGIERLRVQNLRNAVRQQSAALTRVASTLAAHAGEDPKARAAAALATAAVGSGNEGPAGGESVSPDAVAELAAAVSAAWRGTEREWEQQRHEAQVALESGAAARAELQALLLDEREEGRRVAAEAARLHAALEATEHKLLWAEGQLREVRGCGSVSRRGNTPGCRGACPASS